MLGSVSIDRDQPVVRAGGVERPRDRRLVQLDGFFDAAHLFQVLNPQILFDEINRHASIVG